jgi:hypothetical protein
MTSQSTIPTAESKHKPKNSGGLQPKKQASKSKIAVKMRRYQIIRDVLNGKGHAQAGIDSGLSPKTAGQQVTEILKHPEVQNALITAMGKIGITDDCIAERLHALLFATKVISANVFAPGSGTDLADAGSITKDFVEIPDNVALAKGIEIACKIKGQYTDKHEIDIKQPTTIIIKKFCSRGQQPTEKAPGGSPS